MKADSKWRKMENIVAKDVAITYGFFVRIGLVGNFFHQSFIIRQEMDHD